MVEEIFVEADGRHLVADLYRPRAPRGALLLVHGLSPAGRRHPDLVRLATLFAQHDRLVLVPHFDGLAALRLTGREVAEIRAALRSLRARSPSIGIVGMSFGAGPALLAAADASDVALAASFGGYADLRDVIIYLTTGIHRFGDRRYLQAPEDYNRWKLLALLVSFVRDERDRHVLEKIAGQKLADPGADTGALLAGLGPGGHAVHALVVNRREDSVSALLTALPADAQAAIAHLSPLTAVPRVRGRLLIAHGARDISIPFTESLRLAEASAGRAKVVILETFGHTAAQPFWSTISSRLADGRRVLSLTEALLAEH